MKRHDHEHDRGQRRASDMDNDPAPWRHGRNRRGHLRHRPYETFSKHQRFDWREDSDED